MTVENAIRSRKAIKDTSPIMLVDINNGDCWEINKKLLKNSWFRKYLKFEVENIIFDRRKNLTTIECS